MQPSPYGKLSTGSPGCSLQDEGFFIVCNGLVRVRYDVWQGTSQTYFLGTGGMFGLFSALTGGHCCEKQAEGILLCLRGWTRSTMLITSVASLLQAWLLPAAAACTLPVLSAAGFRAGSPPQMAKPAPQPRLQDLISHGSHRSG